MIEWIIIILLVIIILIYYSKYYKLIGEIERRSRETFEKWKLTELEGLKQQSQTQISQIEQQSQRNVEQIREQSKIQIEQIREQSEIQSKEKAKVWFQEWAQKEEERIRKDAINKSKSVIIGKITEHLVPFFPDFKYNPKDARFIGTPIDIIVFDGLDEGNIRNIVFIEVKTGKTAFLTSRERSVRDCIENKNIGLIHIERNQENLDIDNRDKGQMKIDDSFEILVPPHIEK